MRNGETVRVAAGPFTEWLATFEEVNHEKQKVIVLLGINPVPNELDLNQIERA